MKLSRPQPQEPAKQAEAPAVNLGAQKAAHALPDAFRAQAQAPSVRGLATMMSVASGATAVTDYDHSAVDLGIEARVRQIDTPEFKSWFGDSQIVDEQGDPLMVFHGTMHEFDEFSVGHGHAQSEAVFFADRRSLGYLDGLLNMQHGEGTGPRILPVFLKVTNPLIVDLTHDEGFFDPDTENQLIRQAKAEGRDGLILSEPEWGERFYAVFKPEQVKSVFNSGAFSPTDPGICR